MPVETHAIPEKLRGVFPACNLSPLSGLNTMAVGIERFCIFTVDSYILLQSQQSVLSVQNEQVTILGVQIVD